jgi:predicted metal-dependent hydrolase
MNRVLSTRSGDITISITRKRIKNLYLRVTPPDGRVCVNAPLNISDAEIERFVLSRADWIVEQREKIAASRKDESDT